jgi:hypothetical protein
MNPNVLVSTNGNLANALFVLVSRCMNKVDLRTYRDS